MVEAELECVQGHASQWVGFASVTGVAQYWVTQVRHMYTNLVLASGLQLQFHQRIAIGALDGLVVCQGVLACAIVYRT